jgi:hypothetical protein
VTVCVLEWDVVQVMTRMHLREMTICYGMTETSPGTYRITYAERERNSQAKRGRERESQVPGYDPHRDVSAHTHTHTHSQIQQRGAICTHTYTHVYPRRA